MESNPLSQFWADLVGRLPQRRYLDRHRCALTFSLLTLALGFTYLLWLTLLILRKREIWDFLFLAAEILSFLFIGLMAVDVIYGICGAIDPRASVPTAGGDWMNED